MEDTFFQCYVFNIWIIFLGVEYTRGLSRQVCLHFTSHNDLSKVRDVQGGLSENPRDVPRLPTPSLHDRLRSCVQKSCPVCVAGYPHTGMSVNIVYYDFHWKQLNCYGGYCKNLFVEKLFNKLRFNEYCLYFMEDTFCWFNCYGGYCKNVFLEKLFNE